MSERPNPLMPLDEIQRTAIAAIRRYMLVPGTDELRLIAASFVDARRHFFNRDGDPDLLGRTNAYRQWVREIMQLADVPPGDISTLQAAVRYHTGNILRERLDSGELDELGLRQESPRARSAEKRTRHTNLLRLFDSGPELDADEMLEAARVMRVTLRRFRPGTLDSERREAVRAALAELADAAEALAAY